MLFVIVIDVSDFQNWKLTEEKATRSRFVTRYGTKDFKDGTKTIYVCHRSGTFSSRSKVIRQLKSQGSNKMGGHCTAGIEVSQDKSGVCNVVYYKTHFGHELNIGEL